MSTGLAKLNELKAMARSLDIEFSRSVKIDELESMIAQATQEKIDSGHFCKHGIRVGRCSICDADDPFDDIDPEIEGDHLAEPPAEESTTAEINREAWLTKAVTKIAPLLAQAGAVIDPLKVRVSVGFGAGRQATGVCFPTTSSDGNFNESFISPVQDDPIDVLKTLTHELIHASDNCKSGHTGHFSKTAKAVGMVGNGPNNRSWTCPTAGDELRAALSGIALELGPYPHQKMTVGKHKTKQKTYLLKLACDTCTVILRGTAKVINQYEDWSCPCGGKLTVEE